MDMKRAYIKPDVEVFGITNTRSICSVSGGSAAGSGTGEGEENLVKGQFLDTDEDSWQNDENAWQ